VTRQKPKPAPHVHVADPDLPPDPLDRRVPPARVCRTCRLVGRPGDTRHTMPEPVADVASAAAGEGSEL
jgi:hypothetical protein